MELLVLDKKVNGWRRFRSRQRRLKAFYNNDLGLVLKHPVFILDHRTPLALRAPTVYLDSEWVVQPILSRHNLSEALSLIKIELQPHLARGVCPDIHTGNIGWLNGKPLMFDW